MADGYRHASRRHLLDTLHHPFYVRCQRDHLDTRLIKTFFPIHLLDDFDRGILGRSPRFGRHQKRLGVGTSS